MSEARQLAMDIWKAGVDSVRAEQLIAAHVQVDTGQQPPGQLKICSSSLDLSEAGRICVVGAGKAAGYLALAIEDALKPVADSVSVSGLVNVPENCVQPSEWIQLHAARPAGANEPRPEGVQGTQHILREVASLEPDDICLCLLTGGGSALLPAPKSPVTLEDKLRVTQLMSARGATIQELNCVRIALSDVKGGGLARQCGTDRLITSVISDIIGDPLELIASGPTIPTKHPEERPENILASFVRHEEVGSNVWETLNAWKVPEDAIPKGTVHLLANNQTAVQAAADLARAHGLETITLESEAPSCSAEEVGKTLIDHATRSSAGNPRCVVWGGEPIVRLSDSPGRGGRNQQVVLSAQSLWERIPPEIQPRVCILSGGTDGEDGPTDAAGAFVDAGVVAAAQAQKRDVQNALARNDGYPFFDALGGLIKTGPTHTNVCDLRVLVVV